MSIYIQEHQKNLQKAYTVELAHTKYFGNTQSNDKKTIKLPPKPTKKSNKYYDTCLNKFNNKFTNGNFLNCLNCAIEQKLSHVHIKTTKERETQHHLIHALKVAAKGTKVYDDCEQTLTCAVKAKYTDWPEYDRYCKGGKNAGKRIRFQNNLCKRLSS